MITYPLNAPNTQGHPTAQKTKLSGWNTVAMSTSPYTGSQQIYKWPGEGWKLDVSLPPMKMKDAEAWVSFLLALRGRMGTFRFGDTARKTPQGVATGTPVTAVSVSPGLGNFVADGGPTNVFTKSIAIAVGDCVVVFVNNLGNSSYSFVDNGASGGNTYVQVGQTGIAVGRGACWVCLSATVAATNITVTATSGVSLSVGTFKGVTGIGAVHFNALGPVATSTVMTDTIVTTRNNVTLAVGVQMYSATQPASFTVNSGILEASSTKSTNQWPPQTALEAFIAWQISKSGQTVTTQVTASQAMNWQMWSVELYGIGSNQQGDTQLGITGFTPSTKNILKAGDYLEVPGSAIELASNFLAGGGDNSGLTVTTLQAVMGHNISANPSYIRDDFAFNMAPNFTGKSWVHPNGQFITVDPLVCDDSLNPVTPAHVSPVSVKTLIPNYTGKYYAQFEPYRWTIASGHIDIGIDTKSTTYIAAMLADMQARGIDGITLDWYGPNRWEDDVCLLVKAAVATMTNFTFAIMLDTQAETSVGAGAYNTTAKLNTLLAYLNTNYFGATHYWKIGTAPVLLFWGNGPTGVQASVDFAAGIATVSPALYVLFQGPGPITFSYSQGTYDWVQPYLNGVNVTDPYNLAAKTSYLNTVHSNSKGAMPALSRGFNGTLTRSTAWSMGKMLPGGNGACWTQQAALINANLPTNTIGIFLVTWNDWQEGSGIEMTIDNGIDVTAVLTGNSVSWSIAHTDATAVDESTISSYLVIATTDFINAVVVGTQAIGGPNVMDLGNLVRPCNLYVIAIGIACVRSQVSNDLSVPAIGGGGGGGGPVTTVAPSRLYKVLNDVNSDSNGVVTVDLFPALRETVPAGTTIITQSPRGTFRLAGNQQDWNIDEALVYGIQFSAIESI